MYIFANIKKIKARFSIHFPWLTLNLSIICFISLESSVHAISIDEMNNQALRQSIDDMALYHEAKPNSGGPGWKDRPLVVMGAYPYGWSIPQNWPGNRFKEWKVILPWFLIFQELGAKNTINTGVEFKNFQMFFHVTSSGSWIRAAKKNSMSWSFADNINLSSKSNNPFFFRVGDYELYRSSDSHVVHGGLGQYPLPWNQGSQSPDYDAIFVSVQHRLRMIDPNLPTDLSQTKFLVLVGADYYPFMGAGIKDLKANYNPGVGMGRFLKVTNEWRLSSFFVKKTDVSFNILFAPPPKIYE